MDMLQTLDTAAPTLPRGATVVVWRRRGYELEVLVLHRAAGHESSVAEPDWGWSPPSEARRPGEYVGFTALRALREQTGLELKLTLAEASARGGVTDWPVFTAEDSAAATVRLDAGHDRYAWVPLDQGLLRCVPAAIADQLRLALAAAA